MSDQLTQKEWEMLEELLVKVSDMPLPTWRAKRETLVINLGKSGYAALEEIISWIEEA